MEPSITLTTLKKTVSVASSLLLTLILRDIPPLLPLLSPLWTQSKAGLSPGATKKTKLLSCLTSDSLKGERELLQRTIRTHTDCLKSPTTTQEQGIQVQLQPFQLQIMLRLYTIPIEEQEGALELLVIVSTTLRCTYLLLTMEEINNLTLLMPVE